MLQFNKDYYQIFNQHHRICETMNFYPKPEKVNLGPKKLDLGIWTEMTHVCNKCRPISLIAKFRAKIRILKLGTKYYLFGCFGQPS